jgi:hypothetical protein
LFLTEAVFNYILEVEFDFKLFCFKILTEDFFFKVLVQVSSKVDLVAEGVNWMGGTGGQGTLVLLGV